MYVMYCNTCIASRIFLLRGTENHRTGLNGAAIREAYETSFFVKNLGEEGNFAQTITLNSEQMKIEMDYHH